MEVGIFPHGMLGTLRFIFPLISNQNIIPSRLADYAERFDEPSFVKWEGMECVECGSCSFVCPAKRQLKQSIGSMKKIVLANRRKK